MLNKDNIKFLISQLFPMKYIFYFNLISNQKIRFFLFNFLSLYIISVHFLLLLSYHIMFAPNRNFIVFFSLNEMIIFVLVQLKIWRKGEFEPLHAICLGIKYAAS